MIRPNFIVVITLVFLASCGTGGDNPFNQPPEIISVQAPSFVSANDTIFVTTYDHENDTLGLKVSVSTAEGNTIGSALGKLFTDDGLAGDHTANDHIFTGIINRDALQAQNTSQFRFVFTVSEKGQSGGTSQTIIISQNPSNGHPPVISNLIAPDTVNTSLQTEFVVTVHVSDPEGLLDIQSVTMKSPGNNFFNLYDNGVNPDVAANDGIFSGGFSVIPAPSEGNYIFIFQAVDRIGLKSNAIQKTIIIVH